MEGKRMTVILHPATETRGCGQVAGIHAHAKQGATAHVNLIGVEICEPPAAAATTAGGHLSHLGRRYRTGAGYG